MATSVSVAMNLVAKELDGSIPLLTASMTDWRKDSKRRRVVGSAGWGGGWQRGTWRCWGGSEWERG